MLGLTPKLFIRQSTFHFKDELKLVWNSCNLSTLKWFPIEISKDILFSLPTDSMIEICELYFTNNMKIKPPLDDLDEVYLASMGVKSQIINGGASTRWIKLLGPTL